MGTRYSGRDLYVSFNGTALSYIRSLGDNDEAAEIDAGAAGDTREFFLAGLMSGDFDGEMLDDDTTNDNYNAVAPQTTGTLIIAPQGTGSGKRKITYSQTVMLTRGRSYPYRDVVVISFSGRLNSAPTLGTY
jgi:hypothetical protein